MKIVVHPVAAPEQELDLTHRLTAAIAEELRERFGGNEQATWEEAETHLARFLDEVKAEGKRLAEKKAGPCPACPRVTARLRLSTSPLQPVASCGAAAAC